jgi:hypothetical protein
MKNAGKSILVLFFVLTSMSFAQQTEITEPPEVSLLQTRKLIDSPTAGLLPRGSFDVDLKIYPKGGMIAVLDIGITHSIMIAISYGGEYVIEERKPDWYPDMEFAVKLRLVHETYLLPALAIGYDGQGNGPYDDSLKRYTYKAKGFYGVISKNYLMFEEIPVGLHGGINYSLEDKDEDRDISIFLGCDMRFSQSLGVVAEYDLATNDDRARNPYGKGNGYLNAGVQWFFSDNLLMEFDFKNILNNKKNVYSLDRGFRLIYFESF